MYEKALRILVQQEVPSWALSGCGRKETDVAPWGEMCGRPGLGEVMRHPPPGTAKALRVGEGLGERGPLSPVVDT